MAPSDDPLAARKPRSTFWSGDLFYGTAQLISIADGLVRGLQIAGRYRDASTRNGWLLTLLGIVLVLTVSLAGVFGGRRWGMWSYLVITSASVAWNVAHTGLRHAMDSESFLYLVLILFTLIYLPLRLFGRLGPPPR